MQHADIHDSFDRFRSVILVSAGKAKTGNTEFYRVLVPMPQDGPLVFVNISLHAAHICSRRYNPDLHAVQVRLDNMDSPEAVAASLGLHHFDDASRIVASVFR